MSSSTSRLRCTCVPAIANSRPCCSRGRGSSRRCGSRASICPCMADSCSRWYAADLLSRGARSADQGRRARVAAASGAARRLTQPVESAFPVQCAAFHRRTGAPGSETRRAAHRAAGRIVAPGARIHQAPGTHPRAKSSNSSAAIWTSSRCRLGERLRVDWEVAARGADARVPSLILQPLVENAIQHGIAAATRSRHAHHPRAPAGRPAAHRSGGQRTGSVAVDMPRPAAGHRPREHARAPAGPVRRATERGTPQRRRTGREPAHSGVRRMTLSVLIVDDEPLARQRLQRMLRGEPDLKCCRPARMGVPPWRRSTSSVRT